MRLIISLLCLTVLIAHTVGASLLSREGHNELVPEKLPLGFHDADSAASGAAAQSDSDGVIAVVVTDSLLDAFKSVSSSAVKIGMFGTLLHIGAATAIASQQQQKQTNKKHKTQKTQNKTTHKKATTMRSTPS